MKRRIFSKVHLKPLILSKNISYLKVGDFFFFQMGSIDHVKELIEKNVFFILPDRVFKVFRQESSIKWLLQHVLF